MLPQSQDLATGQPQPGSSLMQISGSHREKFENYIPSTLLQIKIEYWVVVRG